MFLYCKFWMQILWHVDSYYELPVCSFTESEHEFHEFGSYYCLSHVVWIIVHGCLMHLNFRTNIASTCTCKDCKCLYSMSVKIATAALPKKFFARHYVQRAKLHIQMEVLGNHKDYITLTAS